MRGHLDRHDDKDVNQEAQGCWKYEWPMKLKARWIVQNSFARSKRKVLIRWLRQVKNLSDTEEEKVCMCKPEVGERLSDEEERSVKDLINCQEGRSELSSF
jgi:hypothetical protein